VSFQRKKIRLPSSRYSGKQIYFVTLCCEDIFSVLAESLDEARQKFRASGRPDSDALFIIKTETEIYLA
jgi:hypothetical protein